MENTGNETLNDLISSLNNSIEEIHNNPTVIDKLPSNLEIIIRGVSDSKSLDFLFSPKTEALINGLFKQIENGNFEKIIQNKDAIQTLLDNIFGEGSFQGPISNAILGNIQNSVQSVKYQTMKSHLGKTVVTLKKYNLIMKNLQKGKKNFEKKSEEYKKYNEAIDAIKIVLKFARKIYVNRNKIIKKLSKASKGMNNIIHEEFYLDFDEPLN